MKVWLLLFGLGLMAFSFNPEAAEPVTIEGTFIDTKCYGMNEANSGNTHAVTASDGQTVDMPNCATACANMGIPTGLLQADGKVIILVTPTNQLAEHMAKEARVTGAMVFEGGIIPEKVEVREGDTWKEVHISTMM
jgi:hypothetical protein